MTDTVLTDAIDHAPPPDDMIVAAEMEAPAPARGRSLPRGSTAETEVAAAERILGVPVPVPRKANLRRRKVCCLYFLLTLTILATLFLLKL